MGKNTKWSSETQKALDLLPPFPGSALNIFSQMVVKHGDDLPWYNP